MSDLSDFFNDEPRVPTGRGGSRPNAGRKPKQPNDDELLDEAGLTPYQRYEVARADKERETAEKEAHLARQARVKADLDEKLVVYRQSVRDAAAKAFSACSQALDSIGDILEREGHPPDVSERVMELINAAKEQLAVDLERTHQESEDA